ncbi:MAG: NADH-quinone oxidoreductase subunit J [Acidobacteria bacterium]|nr:MAG: NADH-quinone oxidoreductase subunit J [Acidobacteriota bacterium]RLE24670.1 MAG: NADH-quinone oxidoreductase subunit J [Acidobacteriota bacterium]
MVIAFYILGFLAIFSAIMVVSSERPIVSGLYLLLCFVAVAGLYITLSAPFVAAMQLIVYSGAIIVLILFVIMLLNQHRESDKKRPKWVTALSIVAAVLIGWGVYFTFITSKIVLSHGKMSPIGGMNGNVEQLANVLFSRYFIPFEVISVLLIAAIISAVFISKKRV